MVRDILIDVDSSDIQFNKERDADVICYETVWGNIFDSDSGNNVVYMNVIIPARYTSFLRYDTDGKFNCYIHSSYKPNSESFYVRFVQQTKNSYIKTTSVLPEQSIAKSYLYGSTTLGEISPAQLQLISMTGYYKIQLSKETAGNIPSVEFYAMDDTDLLIGVSDDQSAKLLALCAPGKNYRYPTTGVGITDFINTVVGNTNLNTKLIEEFKANSTPVQSAEFDSETGELNVLQSAEMGEDEDEFDITTLDLTALKLMTDDNIRSYNASAQSTDTDYDQYIADVLDAGDAWAIWGIDEQKMNMLSDTVNIGKIYSFTKVNFGGTYSLKDNTSYTSYTAHLKRNDIIKIKLPQSGNPVLFITENNDITEQAEFDKRWSEFVTFDSYGECGIILKECYIHYSVLTSSVDNGDGVFLLDTAGDALRNLIVIVQDQHTGNLIGYVTPNSTISDCKMHQVSGQIFITQITDNE